MISFGAFPVVLALDLYMLVMLVYWPNGGGDVKLKIMHYGNKLFKLFMGNWKEEHLKKAHGLI